MRTRKWQDRIKGLSDDRGPISDVVYVFSRSPFSPTRFTQRPQQTRVVARRVKSYTAHWRKYPVCSTLYLFIEMNTVMSGTTSG